jgi:hypothetical protein
MRKNFGEFRTSCWFLVAGDWFFVAGGGYANIALKNWRLGIKFG